MRPVVVIDVVGLTPSMVGQDTPGIRGIAEDGFMAPMVPVLPAVTCPVQSTILTGTLPREHGIVGNGWYFRDLAEVMLWRQSNHLVRGPKLWDRCRLRDPSFTVASVFWWFNMYSTADVAVTVRPVYPADGRKIPDTYTNPPDLRQDLQDRLGTFPLFRFWGPKADILSTRWIARAAALVIERYRPTLTLVYLPHLDYDLQRYGPDDRRIARQLRAVDREASRVIEAARSIGAEVVILSEYGISAVAAPVHINRILREAGLVDVREALGRETLDPGRSRAFAVSDHQVAHVYIRDPADLDRVRSLLQRTPGIDEVLDEAGKRRYGVDHPRSGELVAVSAPDRWFTYYYWLDDARAPDFARTVDIHRKPGYDPAELFLDPTIRFVRLKILRRLLRKALGFRYLLDVIPLDATLVRGSHGRLPQRADEGPVFLASKRDLARDRVEATDAGSLIEGLIFGGP